MKTLRQLLVTVPFLSLVAAAPAFAQPGNYPQPDDDGAAPQYAPPPAPIYAPAPPPGYPQPAPPPQVAPQNADWNTVSNINGQIVPVGQHNDYLYTFRKVNIASNPIGWMAGFYGLSVSYAVSDHIAIRGDGNIFSGIFDSNTNGYEFGISAPIYLRRTYQGPFIEPGLITRAMGDSGSPMTASVGPEMLIGYQVMFDSGLNMAAAVGLAKLSSNDSDGNYDDGSQLSPAGYFRVGYAF